MKHATKVHSKDLHGLKSFREDYPESTVILLYRGLERLLIDGILCLPCDHFLKKLHPEKKIDDACQ